MSAVAPSFTIVFSLSVHVRCQDLFDPLVVTANRQFQPEDQAAIRLAERGDLRDILRMKPNACASQAPGSVFSLRGVSQEGALVAGNRSNPALAVMSGYIPRTTNSLWAVGLPAWDIAEIGVHAGPQPFHEGPYAPGGVVRMVPQVPVFEDSGRFLAEAGGNGKYQSGATMNSVLIPGELAMRLNLHADGNDGGVLNTANDDDRFAATDRLMARGQWRWLPAGDDSTTCDLLVEGIRMRGNSLGLAGMRPDYDVFDRRVSINENERVPADYLAASFHLESSIAPEHKVNTWLTWQHMDGYQLADLDSTQALDWWYRVGVVEKRLTGGATLHHDSDDLNWTVGVYADSARYDLDYEGRGFSATRNGDPFFTDVDETVNMAALFARGEFEFQPEWWLFGGLRLDAQERAVSITGQPVGAARNSDSDRAQSYALLPELGVEWRGNAATAGLKVSRYFQPSGVGYAFSLGKSDPYDAAHGWEIQSYAEWETESFRMSQRMFFAHVRDYQETVAYPGGLPSIDRTFVNAGDALRYGAEMEFGWQGPGSLYTAIHAGWLSTHVDEFEEFGTRSGGGSLPNAPEWNFGLICSWSPPAGWFAETALTWQDGSYSEFSSPQATRVEERLDLSARIGYRWGRVEFHCFGHNILDRDFAMVRRDFTGDGSAVQGSPNLPRTLGAGISIDW